MNFKWSGKSEGQKKHWFFGNGSCSDFREMGLIVLLIHLLDEIQ
jgi:hypothetical protein